MGQSRNQIGLVLVAALGFALAGSSAAIAQDAAKVAVNIDAKQADETPEEVAYQTLIKFVPWALARAQKMTVISDAQRRAIFREFADRRMWRTGIAAGDGPEG